MPVNSAVTASPPPHFGHGWMWVEWKSSLTDSLSHTHTLTYFCCSHPTPPSPFPPRFFSLTHSVWAISVWLCMWRVKTFSSIVLPLSLFRASSWTPQQVFSSVKQQLFSLIGLSLPVPEWNQLHWADFSWGGKKKVILSIIIIIRFF